MNKERAIMELQIKSMEWAALECCQGILESYNSIKDLAIPIADRINKIEEEIDNLCDIVAGGELRLENLKK